MKKIVRVIDRFYKNIKKYLGTYSVQFIVFGTRN